MQRGSHRRTDADEVGRGRRRPRLTNAQVPQAWRHLAGERRTIGLLAVLSFITAQAESATLLLLALIAGAFIRDADRVVLDMASFHAVAPINVTILVAVAALVVASIAITANVAISSAASARIERQTRDRIMTSYAEADWEYQATQKSSRVHGRFRLMTGYSRAFSGLTLWMRGVITIASFIAISAAVSPAATLMAIGLGILLSAGLLPLRRRLTRLIRETAALEVSLGDDVSEAMDQGADVQVFGAWPEFLRRFARRSKRLEVVRRRATLLGDLMPTVYQYGALLLMLVALAIATAAGEGLTGIAGSALLMLRTLQYGQLVQTALRTLAQSVPYIDQYEREIDTPKPRMTPGDVALDGIRSIELRDVSYRYPGADRLALSDITLNLRPGSIVGLAGPSGSGKSTLGQVLLRLRWPTSGEFLVNGQPANVMSADSWTRQVVDVPQRPRLLHGTVDENVRYLGGTASSGQVEAALASVGLADLVGSLEGGLNAQVGPTTRNLSGGQEQRIGIARALVRSPSLVVLDEPTSALDGDSERDAVTALRELSRRAEMIVVVIAHRPTTLALCDEVFVLRDGRLSPQRRIPEVMPEETVLAGRDGHLMSIVTRCTHHGRGRTDASGTGRQRNR